MPHGRPALIGKAGTCARVVPTRQQSLRLRQHTRFRCGPMRERERRWRGPPKPLLQCPRGLAGTHTRGCRDSVLVRPKLARMVALKRWTYLGKGVKDAALDRSDAGRGEPDQGRKGCVICRKRTAARLPIGQRQHHDGAVYAAGRGGECRRVADWRQRARKMGQLHDASNAAEWVARSSVPSPAAQMPRRRMLGTSVPCPSRPRQACRRSRPSRLGIGGAVYRLPGANVNRRSQGPHWVRKC